ncbi:hypothetical protein LLG95_10125 [bacterium]|nr:hypothetical protein [bacterium]
MKFLRALSLTLLLLGVLAVALDRLLSGLWGLGVNPILGRLFAWSPALINPLTSALNAQLWAAAALMLLAIYWVLCVTIWLSRPRPLRVRTLSGGTMLIHPGAIIKFVKMQIDSHPAVISSRVRVRQTGNSNLAVGATINVQPIESLPVIDEQIKVAVRDGLSQVMGIEKIDEITLLLDIDQKNISLKPGPSAEAEPEPIPPARASLHAGQKAGTAEAAPEPAPSHEIHFEEPAKEAPVAAPETEAEPPVEAEPERLRDQEQIFMPGLAPEETPEETEEKKPE